MRIGVEGFVGTEGGAISFKESGSRKGGIVSRVGGRLLWRGKVLPPAKSGDKSGQQRQKLAVDAVSDQNGGRSGFLRSTGPRRAASKKES
jgi:hypothetical protein